MGEENELLKQISKPLPILSVFFTSILFLSIQQFLKKKKHAIGFKSYLKMAQSCQKKV